MRPLLAQGVGLSMGLALHARNLQSDAGARAVNGRAEQLTDFQFWFYVGMVIFLTLMAGLMSGLTLGLMSLDSVELEILKRTGSPSRQASAASIVPLLHNPHRLLVTLLLCNSVAAEALPLYLDRLANPVTAVIVSVTVVLLFGEIIPQAVCSSHGLEVGAWSAPFVHVLMFLSAPLAVPIAWILDHVLGKHQTALFKRSQLKALVDIHQEGQAHGGPLSPDEVSIIKGALDLTAKTAEQAMTPLDLVFMLSTNTVLDASTRTAILASGHSRIPVYRAGNRNDILGITLIKEMVQGLEGVARSGSSSPPRVGDLKIRSMPTLLSKTPMYDMLKLFKIGRSHMAILARPTEAARAARAAQAAAERKLYAAYDTDDSTTTEEGLESWLLPRTLSRRKKRRRKGKKKDRTNPSSNSSSSSSSSSSSESEDEEVDPHSDADLLVNWRPDELVAVGIITIEDVIEELIQSEIVDETDEYVDNLQKMRVNARALTSSLPPHLRRLLGTKQLVPRIGSAAEVEALSRSMIVTPENDPVSSLPGALRQKESGLPITSHPLPTLSLSARDGLLDALSRELSDSLVVGSAVFPYSHLGVVQSQKAVNTHNDAVDGEDHRAAKAANIDEDRILSEQKERDDVDTTKTHPVASSHPDDESTSTSAVRNDIPTTIDRPYPASITVAGMAAGRGPLVRVQTGSVVLQRPLSAPTTPVKAQSPFAQQAKSQIPPPRSLLSAEPDRSPSGVRRSSTGGGKRGPDPTPRRTVHFSKEVQDQLERIVPIMRRVAAERRGASNPPSPRQQH